MVRERKAGPKSETPSREISDRILRRDDPQTQQDNLVKETDLIQDMTDNLPGISPSEDGGVAEHPIHDEDFNEDFDSDDYEAMIDEVEETGGVKAPEEEPNAD